MRLRTTRTFILRRCTSTWADYLSQPGQRLCLLDFSSAGSFLLLDSMTKSTSSAIAKNVTRDSTMRMALLKNRNIAPVIPNAVGSHVERKCVIATTPMVRLVATKSPKLIYNSINACVSSLLRRALFCSRTKRIFRWLTEAVSGLSSIPICINSWEMLRTRSMTLPKRCDVVITNDPVARMSTAGVIMDERIPNEVDISLIPAGCWNIKRIFSFVSSL